MLRLIRKPYSGARWQSEGLLKGLKLGPPLKGKDAEYDTYIDPALDEFLATSNLRNTTKKTQIKKSQSPKTSGKLDARQKTKSQLAAQATYPSHAK